MRPFDEDEQPPEGDGERWPGAGREGIGPAPDGSPGEPGGGPWPGGGTGPEELGWDELEDLRWPLHPGGLLPRERWRWFENLWRAVCALRLRYRLPVRAGWWEDPVQTEALAAFAAWVDRYDSGEWDDPPGKLALLYDLERLGVLLRDGREPFSPDRDRLAFTRHLIDVGCHPPPFAA